MRRKTKTVSIEELNKLRPLMFARPRYRIFLTESGEFVCGSCGTIAKQPILLRHKKYCTYVAHMEARAVLAHILPKNRKG